ncbi:MAG TPA: hypothetical protein V6D29_15835 [Leptolyngbyaceae cyanobacterium]
MSLLLGRTAELQRRLVLVMVEYGGNSRCEEGIDVQDSTAP